MLRVSEGTLRGPVVPPLFCAYSSLYPSNSPLLPPVALGDRQRWDFFFPFGQLESNTAACQMWHLWEGSAILPLAAATEQNSKGYLRIHTKFWALEKTRGSSFVVMSLEKKICMNILCPKRKKILDSYSRMWLQVKATLPAMTWTLLPWAVPSVLWSWNLGEGACLLCPPPSTDGSAFTFATLAKTQDVWELKSPSTRPGWTEWIGGKLFRHSWARSALGLESIASENWKGAGVLVV